MKYLKSYFCQEYMREERWVWKGCIICKVKPESTTFCIEARGALGLSQSSPENKYQALIHRDWCDKVKAGCERDQSTVLQHSGMYHGTWELRTRVDNTAK